jgi:hypothetical protein
MDDCWENEEVLRDREAVLANGGHLPLADAVRWYDRLVTLVGADQTEWDVLYSLRQLALGRQVDREPLGELVREGLATPDGRLDPGLRDVILSAVRGEDHRLRLESPFTDSLDRALAEFRGARDQLYAAIDAGQLEPLSARQFLSPSRFHRAMDQLQEPTSPVPPSGEEEFNEGSLPPPPSEETKAFAARVMQRWRRQGSDPGPAGGTPR